MGNTAFAVVTEIVTEIFNNAVATAKVNSVAVRSLLSPCL
jgi:hypothetical protein